MLPELSEVTLTFCHVGRGKRVLTPPPVAPPPLLVLRPGVSHQVTSFTLVPDVINVVPPTSRVNGLQAGKPTWALPSSIWSPEASSPDETQVVMPSKRAAFNRSLMAATALVDQPGSSSANPQLIESTAGFAAITALREVHPTSLVEGRKIDRDFSLGTQASDDLHVHHHFDTGTQLFVTLLGRKRENLLQRQGGSIDCDG
jgi:hypothetical protein